jgi:hypothetical protein
MTTTTKTDKVKAKTNGSVHPLRRDALARLGELIDRMGRNSKNGELTVRMINNSTFEITGTDSQGKVTRTFEDKDLWK